MKKFFVTLFSIAATAVFAAAPLSFEQILSNAATPEQIAAIKSTKLVYQVFAEGEPAAKLVIRTQRPAKMRIDVISPKDSYAACHSGTSGWGYSKKDGFYDLSAEEISEMHHDADFLPIPIDDKPAFSAPVADGEEDADGVPCFRYKSHSLSGKELNLTLWVDKKDSLLRKVEAEDADSKTTTFFRNYKTIGGIKLATQLYVSDSDGFHKMTLQSATWNPVFAPNLFVKPDTADHLAVPVTKTPASYQTASIPRRKGSPNEIAALQKKIAKLEIRIKDDENKLSTIEKLIGDDRANATSLASVTTPVRYRSYWSRYGFIVNRSSNNSGRRTRHRMINKLNRETKKAMQSYKAINKELIRYRIQLAEAKAQLAAIDGSK